MADVAAEIQPLFQRQQFAEFRKLSDLLMPSLRRQPGALDARAPEFLDFLIASSLEE